MVDTPTCRRRCLRFAHGHASESEMPLEPHPSRHPHLPLDPGALTKLNKGEKRALQALSDDPPFNRPPLLRDPNRRFSAWVGVRGLHSSLSDDGILGPVPSQRGTMGEYASPFPPIIHNSTTPHGNPLSQSH